MGDTHMYRQGLPALQLINSCSLVNVVVMMINSAEHNYDGQSISARCKDGGTAGRTKGVRHTCPELLKGRGEARYFAPKGTQGKGGVRRKSKAEGISAGDSPGSDQSARPEVRGVQDEGNESGIW